MRAWLQKVLAIKRKDLQRLYLGLTISLQKDRILTEEQTALVIRPILLICLLLTFSAFILTIISTFYYAPTKGYHVSSSSIVSGFALAIFTLLIWITNYKPIAVAWIFTSTLLLGSLYGLVRAGFVTPQPLLAIVIAILGAIVLIGSLGGYIFFSVTCVFLVYISYVQIKDPSVIALRWTNTQASLGDISLIIISFCCIFYLMRVLIRDNKQSLYRAVSFEKASSPPLVSLKQTILNRDELILNQEVTHFHEKVNTSFHDIAQPIQTSLQNLEELIKHPDTLNEKERRNSLLQVFESTKLLHQVIENLRLELAHFPLPNEYFSVTRTITDLKKTFIYLLRREAITLVITGDDAINLYGQKIAFHRIVKNLIQNAIEAHRHSHSPKKLIEVSVLEQHKQITIIVTDNAGGIPASLKKSILTPHFSTKLKEGAGFGLTYVKNELKEKFHGQLFVRSHRKKTSFTLHFEKHAHNITSQKSHP